ncbi:MAG: transcription termination/antitermination NusG family protein [Planctomycetales bacterium]
MPILGQEPDLYPQDLLDRHDVGTETDRVWWGVHTLPRQEKTLARKLHARQIWHYLPQVKKESRSPAGRVRKSFVPLFASYVFFYGSEKDRLAVLETGCVAKLLLAGDGAKLTADLRQVKRLIDSGATITFEPVLEPGTPVRVTTGPFQGFEGRVLKRHSGDRLLVIVNYLQQGISVALEDSQVERID